MPTKSDVQLNLCLRVPSSLTLLCVSCRVGLRVMKTQDGVELGLLDRDAVFLAEHGMDTKERLDRARLGQLDTAAVTGHYAVRPRLREEVDWAGGRVHTPSWVPHRWDATSCRDEAAPQRFFPYVLPTLQGNEAYSVYSQEAELEQYPSGLATTGTAPKGPNPFGKNCKFSKPIGDFTKDVTEE